MEKRKKQSHQSQEQGMAVTNCSFFNFVFVIGQDTRAIKQEKLKEYKY